MCGDSGTGFLTFELKNLIGFQAVIDSHLYLCFTIKPALLRVTRMAPPRKSDYARNLISLAYLITKSSLDDVVRKLRSGYAVRTMYTDFNI